MQHADQSRPQMISSVEPFLFQTLQSTLGRHVVIQTTKGSMRGRLTDVKPDHLTLQMEDATFLIRTQEIVWVLPKA
ncbi:YuzF family protein [Halalkalibacterium halodurans]|uniref:BH2251 protein n=1 Tax=Halalkalibacterium halodurans (strain ATCC BAA-125 / DSM 18197 / FERM 7344 / JCM 9153 / C-125) TaxID=272558 RepID=Q9KAN6_HALH5|nr:YuzF family protein [Halalkalibacterium halodurans]BAB05970.1 BH2251 [Halalkalibacterium halodurans C-125]